MANSATFISSDTTTQGDWANTYGSDGWVLADGGTGDPAGSPSSSSNKLLPSYVSFGSTTGSPIANNWGAGATDVRSVPVPFDFLLNARITACWYSTSSFTIDVTISGTTSKPMWLYLLDYDNLGRGASISIADGDTGTVLDTRSTSSMGSAYENGVYFGWSLLGHIKITLTCTAGPNVALNGIFFNQWSSLGDDTFSRANTSYDATPGNTDAVGNGWIDVSGNAARIQSDQLVYTGSGAYTGNPVTRPTASESYINQKFNIQCTVGDGNTRSFFLRFNGTNNGYLFTILGGTSFRLYTDVSGGTSLVNQATISGVPSSSTVCLISLTVMHSGPTLVFGNITNTARTSNYSDAYYGVDFSDNTSALQSASAYGFSGTGTSEYVFATEMQWLEGDVALAPPVSPMSSVPQSYMVGLLLPGFKDYVF